MAQTPIHVENSIRLAGWRLFDSKMARLVRRAFNELFAEYKSKGKTDEEAGDLAEADIKRALKLRFPK